MPTLAELNQNPGNLKNPQGGFQQFPTPEEGRAALYNDLTAKMTGTSTTGLNGNSSILDFAKVYAPKSDNNDPVQYTANLANQLGVSPDTKIGTLAPRIDEFAQAISKNEGYPTGKTQPQGLTSSNTYHQQLQQQNQQEEPTSFLRKALDFAFPIAGDVYDWTQGKNKKTALQTLGDLGLSALWFVPGVGEVAGGAIKGAGLLGEVGSRIAGEALGGAATGYAADILSKASEGKTNLGDVLTPGAGAITGGVLGGVLGKLGSKYGQSGVISDVTKTNNSVLGQTKRGAADLAESFAKDKNPGEFLAQKGINLPAMVNPETVAFDTASKASELRGASGKLNSVLSEALQNVQGTKSVSELESAINEKMSNFFPDKVTASEAQDVVSKEFEKIKAQYGENLTAAELNDLKHRAWDLSKFDAVTPGLTRRAYRNIGNTLKTTVEDMAKSSGLDGVPEFNQYMGSHLDAADALDRLHGTKAKGGRLGDLMQKHTMGVIGAGAGGIFGGGPLGALLGGITGEYAGGKLSQIMRKASASPLKTAILNQMQREDPQVVQKVLEYARQTPHGQQAMIEQLKRMGFTLPEEKISPILSQKAPISPLAAPRQPGVISKGITGAITGAGVRAAQTGGQ